MANFWEKLQKPISASAPLAGVSDAVFRKILAMRGKPSVIWTEMVSLAGVLIRGEAEFKNEMIFSAEEHPIVFQFFGSNPEEFAICGKLAKERGADGIDINMGCPDKGVEKQGAGAHIIKYPSLAKEIIASAKENAYGLPVSVKTRIGYASAGEMEKWITSIAEMEPVAITIHGRTRNEKRKGKANWEKIKEAGQLIKSISPKTIVVGNGDVSSKEEGEKRVSEAEIDGYMVGRALIGNPWFFTGHNTSQSERIAVAREHLNVFNELLGETESFEIVKKHLVGYINGFMDAKRLRTKLMETKNVSEALELLGS